MTLTQILAVIRARWLTALIAFTVVMGSVIALTAMLPRKYEAASTVLVDFKMTDALSGQIVPGVAPASYIATQVDVIRSGRVAAMVIERLRLGGSAELRARWAEETEGRGQFEPWLAELLRRNLDVRPTRDSGALRIVYASPDPEFSATMANAFAEAYISTTVELRTEPARQFSGFFDERARAARDALEAAQARLSDFQRQRGLLATDERFDIETTRLQELNTQLVILQSMAAETSGRSAQAGTSGDRMQEVLNNGLLVSLTADLSRQQARLQELSSRLGDANPQVVEIRASIDELRRRIDAETSRVTASVGVNNNVAQSRLQQVQAALQEQRARVLRMKEQRDEAAVLERDVEIARQTYQSMLQRMTQTGVESQSNQSNVSIIERASEPTDPASPRTRLNLAAGLVLALIVAVLATISREWRDRRLRTVDDVQLIPGVELLAIMPNVTPKALGLKASPGLLARPQPAR